jgi:hypothetical protein
MNLNQIIKTSYHLFATFFLLFLIFYIKNKYIRIILLFLAIFHLYDTWWFLNNEKGNAPI